MVIGVTGGVGSGKTTVVQFLAKIGWHTINVDTLAKDIIEQDKRIREQLITCFGVEYFNSQGQLKGRKLGKKIFSNAIWLHQLNEIVWPVLIPVLNEKIIHLKNQSSTHIAVDMAVIFESECQFLFDVIVIVIAPLAKKTDWLTANRQWTIDEINQRMASQSAEALKIKYADYVIENDTSIDDLQEKIFAFIRWIEQKTLMKRKE